jgi:hypothetical protein
MKRLAEQLTVHRGAIIICIVAALALSLSTVNYIRARDHIAFDNAFARYRTITQLYHSLDNDGELTNQDKQTVLPMLLWAGSALMKRDWDRVDFYLDNAVAILGSVDNKSGPLAVP